MRKHQIKKIDSFLSRAYWSGYTTQQTITVLRVLSEAYHVMCNSVHNVHGIPENNIRVERLF